jgi:hypothetical protein
MPVPRITHGFQNERDLGIDLPMCIEEQSEARRTEPFGRMARQAIVELWPCRYRPGGVSCPPRAGDLTDQRCRALSWRDRERYGPFGHLTLGGCRLPM